MDLAFGCRNMGPTAMTLPLSTAGDRMCVSEVLRPMCSMAFEGNAVIKYLDAQACQEL